MKKIFLIILLTLILFPFHAQAICEGPIVPCGRDLDGNAIITPNEMCNFCHLFALLDNILRFILTCLVPIVAVLMFTIAGVMFIVSRGAIVKKQATFFSQAKAILTAVITGLVVIFVSWVFLNLFLSTIGVAEWTGLDPTSANPWWRINCP